MLDDKEKILISKRFSELVLEKQYREWVFCGLRCKCGKPEPCLWQTSDSNEILLTEIVYDRGICRENVDEILNNLHTVDGKRFSTGEGEW